MGIKFFTILSNKKTIIHEAIHAYILYEIDESRKTVEKNDFMKDLESYYKAKKNKEDPNLAQHDFMSQYVEAMAMCLLVYERGKHSYEYYEAISWGGLETSSAYQSKTQEEKDNIQKIIHNERFNNSKGGCK